MNSNEARTTNIDKMLKSGVFREIAFLFFAVVGNKIADPCVSSWCWAKTAFGRTDQWENMMRIRSILPILLLASVTASVTASAAFAAPAVTTVKTDKGDVLAGEKGMTLYTFKNDKMGESNCYDACATNWPPFMATA